MNPLFAIMMHLCISGDVINGHYSVSPTLHSFVMVFLASLSDFFFLFFTDKADKKAAEVRRQKSEEERQYREDSMREMSIRMREKEREKYLTR